MNYLCHSLELSCAGCNHPATHTQGNGGGWKGGSGDCSNAAQQCNVFAPGGGVAFQNTHTHTHTHTDTHMQSTTGADIFGTWYWVDKNQINWEGGMCSYWHHPLATLIDTCHPYVYQCSCRKYAGTKGGEAAL